MDYLVPLVRKVIWDGMEHLDDRVYLAKKARVANVARPVTQVSMASEENQVHRARTAFQAYQVRKARGAQMAYLASLVSKEIQVNQAGLEKEVMPAYPVYQVQLANQGTQE